MARTYKQRAALKKAQLASARKRRRRAAIVKGAKVAGALAGTAATYHAKRYLLSPRDAVKDYDDFKGSRVAKRLGVGKPSKNPAQKDPVAPKRRKPINPYRNGRKHPIARHGGRLKPRYS